MPETTKNTLTFEQIMANLETALNELLDQQGTAASGGAAELVDQLKAQLIGAATAGAAESHQSLGALQDLLYLQINNMNTRVVNNERTLQALDDTYATDSDVAARVQAVNDAMAAADDDLSALVNERITTADAATMVDAAKAEVQTYVDQAVTNALTGITEIINTRLAAV